MLSFAHLCKNSCIFGIYAVFESVGENECHYCEMWSRLTISATAALLLCSCGEDGGQQSAAAQLPVYTVKVEHPKLEDVMEYREWVGALQGLVSAAIEPQVSGYVTERLFTNGQRVKTGELLYKIEPTRYQQALAEAEQRELQSLANEQESAQHLAYNEPLVKAGAISRQTFTDAQQQLQASQAALAAAKAATAQARTNLSYCELRSPIDGLAGFAQADVGSYVAPGNSAMVLINSVDPIRVQFSISANDWLAQGGEGGVLHPGAQVELLLPNGRRYEHLATIEGVDNTLNTDTGSLRMQALAPNPAALLRPGMFVTVRVRMAEQVQALMVPVGAIVSIQGAQFVLVVNPDSSVRTVPVTTGIQQGGYVVVTGKLSAADSVVVSGTQRALMAAEGRARLNIQP